MSGNAFSIDGKDVVLWSPSFAASGGGIAAFSRELALALSRMERLAALRSKDVLPGIVAGMCPAGAVSAPAGLQTAWFAASGVAATVKHRPRWLVATHAHFTPATHVARLLSGCRSIAVTHGMEIHGDMTHARRYTLARADAVWAVSRWTRERCIAVGVDPARIHIVGNTVDGTRFVPGARDPALAQRYGIGMDARVVLTVARLDANERYKGYDRVLQSLARLGPGYEDVRYLLVGDGGDRGRVRSLAGELGLEERLILTGFVPDIDLPAHYRLADAFAMPSRGEGFGIVFLEAMASGVPVLGGCEDGTRDALDDGRLGMLVAPDDVQAITAGLREMLDRSRTRSTLETSGLRQACLALHGRDAFAMRVLQGISKLEGDRH